MLSHHQLWAAIDALAERHSLTPSGLARRAGLDATSFNKSKRTSPDGRPRWPSTESLAKILSATGVTLDEMVSLISGSASKGQTVPLIGFAKAGAGGYFDDAGFPQGEGWEEIAVPPGTPEGSYALQVQGDSMLPLYRDGDILIVDPSASVRKGDRVVVRTRGGEVTAKLLAARNSEAVELVSLNPEHPNRTIPMREVEWIARIIWASQ